ncbi:MAG: aminotransferase class III-fold pyridoxal phosphate-dependent enzyme [Myxococcota bacterium]|nr:aminotransferase class III-fold pyridoxal phosphate-dependent enzyme [Myxococcota bacterium]
MNTVEMLREGYESYRRYVNPLVTLRAELLGEPTRITGVQDGRLVEARGHVEDFHGTQTFGHRHPAITAAVTEFLASDSPNWFPCRVNPYAGLLAKRLCERSGAYDNVFFANSGSGAVEAAMKLARAATKKPRIISLDGAYHGTTMGSCALMKPGMFKDPFGPHVPEAGPIPFDDVDALAAAFRDGGVAAVVLEPIQLEGGVRTVSPAFLAAACELTQKHGALLVADEIQTGLGRTGRFLASETWPRRPDALILGKHLGGGLVPISGMLTRSELFDRAYGEHYASAEAHNTTFGGSALCCVAALAALDLLTDDVIARVGRIGEAFRAKLASTLARHELFARVKGAGLLVGIELVPSDHPWLSFEHFGIDALHDQPTIGVLTCHRLYKRGFYCFACGHDWRILRVLPRFTIEESTLDSFVTAIDEELEYLCNLT